MSTDKQDTITLELPIEAHDDGYVSVTGVVSVSREYWRKIAANPNATLNDMVRTIAPAVVAWIERDEWEPLDVPDKGRTIKATLRDGRVETFEVTTANDHGDGWVFLDAGYSIQRTLDADFPTADDIVAWEYVDEPVEVMLFADAAKSIADQLQASVDTFKATVDAIRAASK